MRRESQSDEGERQMVQGNKKMSEREIMRWRKKKKKEKGRKLGK